MGRHCAGWSIPYQPQEEITHYTDSNRLSNNQIRTVQEDNNGHIWVGTFNGLNHYNPNSDTWSAHLHQDNIDYGLSHNSINCLYKDLQGTIWIGTYFGGVNYFNLIPTRVGFMVREQQETIS